MYFSATCRRPIRGAAGRPLVGDTWLDESRLRLKELRETSSSSTYTETRSVPRVAAVPLTASKPAAPPAVKTRARRSLPVWVAASAAQRGRWIPVLCLPGHGD